MRLGAIMARADNVIEQAMAKYGMHLGTAFQLVDDVLDYSGDEQATGKNLGDDLAEGKPTLPLIYAMQQGDASQAALIKQAIEQGEIGQHDSGLFADVLNVIKQTGALEYTRQQAQLESNAACAALTRLPDTKYKQTLLQLADFATTRQF